MLKWIIGIVGIVAIAIGGAVVIINFFPGVAVRALQAAAAHQSGLKRKSVTLKGYVASYYEGGPEDAETIILLHGLADDKNSFVTTVSNLTKTYRVILPDLAGHGENEQDSGRDYSIRGQAKFIDDLASAIGDPSFHIGGNSMGGHVAAAYAYHHPEKVRSLILINATGMQMADESVYRYFPEKIDRTYIDDMFGRIFANKPNIPGFMISYMVQDLQPKIPFFNALISAVENGEDFRMNELAANVTAPSLVLWGAADPVVPVPYAAAYHQALRNSHLKILDNAGHSPQFEIPYVLQKEIGAFLGDVQS